MISMPVMGILGTRLAVKTYVSCTDDMQADLKLQSMLCFQKPDWHMIVRFAFKHIWFHKWRMASKIVMPLFFGREATKLLHLQSLRPALPCSCSTRRGSSWQRPAMSNSLLHFATIRLRRFPAPNRTQHAHPHTHNHTNTHTNTHHHPHPAKHTRDTGANLKRQPNFAPVCDRQGRNIG